MDLSKKKTTSRAWTFARAVMKHDDPRENLSGYSRLAKGWQSGYDAARRDVRRILARDTNNIRAIDELAAFTKPRR